MVKLKSFDYVVGRGCLHVNVEDKMSVPKVKNQKKKHGHVVALIFLPWNFTKEL